MAQKAKEQACIAVALITAMVRVRSLTSELLHVTGAAQIIFFLNMLQVVCRLAAVALIGPLGWESPYAVGLALKSEKKKTTLLH